jgi:hypothetical protein
MPVVTILIYVYNGEWTLASDTDGSSELPGWMVDGSRVNNLNGIELKVNHFSAVHAATISSDGGGGSEDDDGDDEDSFGCFLKTLM